MGVMTVVRVAEMRAKGLVEVLRRVVKVASPEASPTGAARVVAVSEAGEGGGGERGLVTEAVGRAAARVAAGTVV